MNHKMRRGQAVLAGLLFLGTLAGCGHHAKEAQQTEEEKIKSARASLSPEDQALVEAQEYCAVRNKNHLGSMGAPVKVMVKDQPVFLCCDSCEKKALEDPDKTLAKLEELKAKVKAEHTPK